MSPRAGELMIKADIMAFMYLVLIACMLYAPIVTWLPDALGY